MEGSPGPRGRGRDGAKRRAARSARFAGDRPTQREEEKGALCGQRLSLLPRPRVSQCLNTLNSSKNGGASRTGGPARRMTRFRRSPGVEQKKNTVETTSLAGLNTLNSSIGGGASRTGGPTCRETQFRRRAGVEPKDRAAPPPLLFRRRRVSQRLNTLNSSIGGGAYMTTGPARGMNRPQRSPGVEPKD